MADPHVRGARGGWIAVLVVCSAVFIFRAGTASQSPVTWDEPVYLSASRAYVNWMKDVIMQGLSGEFTAPFSAENINRYWQRHLPSPPLAKTINGLCGAMLSPALGTLGGLRSGSALMYAMLFGFVLVHLRRILKEDASFAVAAPVAVLVLLVNPRLFSHAGTANLDTIGMAFTYLALYWFWKTSETPGWKATVVCGILWGCAFAAKNTAVLAVPIFILWMLLYARRRHLLARFLLMQPIAILVVFLLWPWLWHDTLTHLREFSRWAGFSGILEHAVGVGSAGDTKLERSFGISTSGLLIDGNREIPWHYSFTVLGAVLPLPTLLLLVSSTLLFLFREWKRSDLAFCVLGAWMPLAITVVTPVYDMERFLLLAMPFQALLCASIVCRIPGIHQRSRQVVILGLTALSFLPAIHEWKQVYPYEFSFYNAAVGRLPGAVAKGFPGSYWLQAHRGLLPFINAELPRGATLACEEWGVLKAYQEFGVLRSDLMPCRITNAKSAKKCSYFLRREPVNEEVREALDPLHTFSLEGVPLATVFRVTGEFVEFRRQKDLENRRKKRQKLNTMPSPAQKRRPGTGKRRRAETAPGN